MKIEKYVTCKFCEKQKVVQHECIFCGKSICNECMEFPSKCAVVIHNGYDYVVCGECRRSNKDAKALVNDFHEYVRLERTIMFKLKEMGVLHFEGFNAVGRHSTIGKNI